MMAIVTEILVGPGEALYVGGCVVLADYSPICQIIPQDQTRTVHQITWFHLLNPLMETLEGDVCGDP